MEGNGDCAIRYNRMMTILVAYSIETGMSFDFEMVIMYGE